MKILSLIKNDPTLIYEIRQGIERETLRSNCDGFAALTPHPVGLGSKLTHANITTDYSENLLEFISGVHADWKSLVAELNAIHAFTQNNINEEVLWTSSMPSILPDNEELIPLANYGTSNVGQLKTLYRRGLGHRYGRSMQSIAGVHFNFSLTDAFWELCRKEERSELNLKEYKNEKYFHLIRNFQRYRWILLYLFGATPAVDSSFLKGKKHTLSRMSDSTHMTPFGTSLRMGGLGYTSSAQEGIGICYNQVETYVKTLEAARLTSFGPYERIGLKDQNGFKQLNTNLLQIDNEFYSTIRPKNVARSEESALMALHKRGIEYIEVRLLDIDPFSPLGISSETAHFLHLFLLWCLTKDSSSISSEECRETDMNFSRVVLEGRKQGLKLLEDGEEVELSVILKQVFEELTSLTGHVQKVDPFYAIALDKQIRKIENIDNLPSQKVLNGMGTDSFINFHLNLANENKEKFIADDTWNEKLQEFSKVSWEEQKRIEEGDEMSFPIFLDQYFEKIKINKG